MWHHRIGSTPDSDAMRFRRAGRWRTLTWADAGDQVRALANALLSEGVALEDRCVVLAATSVQWILADLGVLSAGCATTTIYPKSSDRELKFIVSDSEAVVVFTDTAAQVDRLRQIRDEVPQVRRVVVFDPAAADGDWVVSFDAFEAKGRAWAAEQPEAYVERRQQIEPGHMATLMYTSGTTGRPRGVILDHEAWVYKAAAIDALGVLDPSDVQFLWLPLSHVFAKVLQLTFIRLGIPTVVDGSAEDLGDNLRATQPTWMAAVPETFERARRTIEAQITHKRDRTAFRWAMAVGRRRSAVLRRGGRPGVLLRAQWQIVDRLVMREIRARFGGRMRFLISGGAPLPPELAEFFHAAGLLILEGYGLTESTAACCVNRPDNARFGTVGLPLPGCEIRIAPDGEVLIGGPGLMRGYWRDNGTENPFTQDGFLKTGDIGLLLPTGQLQITGRKREIIVTSSGKNIAPAHFEQLLRTRCTYVSQVVMHGDDRPFCSALLTLDPEAITSWATEHGVPTDSVGANAQIHELIQGYVDAVNRTLPSFEQVRRFAVLDEPFTESNGLLTPSRKVRRGRVQQRYAAVLDAFYSAPGRVFSSN